MKGIQLENIDYVVAIANHICVYIGWKAISKEEG